MRSRKVSIFRKNEKLLENVILANNFTTRLRGLMFYDTIPASDGLILFPCDSVHTFWMKFPLDLIYLDYNGKVIECFRNVVPNRIIPRLKKTFYILETPTGVISNQKIEIDQRLWW